MAQPQSYTWLYILQCSDHSYYTGTYRGHDLAVRVSEHNLGKHPRAYTARRRPVKCVWSEQFLNAADAIERERQIKGWSRKKKLALINGDWDNLRDLSKRGKR